jgi:hypothetical protein
MEDVAVTIGILVVVGLVLVGLVRLGAEFAYDSTCMGLGFDGSRGLSVCYLTYECPLEDAISGECVPPHLWNNLEKK